MFTLISNGLGRITRPASETGEKVNSLVVNDANMRNTMQETLSSPPHFHSRLTGRDSKTGRYKKQLECRALYHDAVSVLQMMNNECSRDENNVNYGTWKTPDSPLPLGFELGRH